MELLEDEMNRRLELLKTHNAKSIYTLREKIPEIIFIHDEYLDDFDANKIDPTLTTEVLLQNELNDSLSKMKDSYKLDLLFTEEDKDITFHISKIIFPTFCRRGCSS